MGSVLGATLEHHMIVERFNLEVMNYLVLKELIEFCFPKCKVRKPLEALRPTSRAPRAKSRWQTSAVERAQPILSDLRRRDGGLSPEEEELSEHSWNEIIEDV